MSSLNEIRVCEVCGKENLASVLDLGHHPLCDDLVIIGDPRICKEYPIEILFCDKCITAHQRFQVPKQELFPASYHYRARHTADVVNGMRQLVSSCKDTLGDLNGKKVLDVGCNDGSLLSIFEEHGAITFGIEPTGAYKDAAERGHKVMNEFFSEGTAEKFVGQYGQPDIITFTNVFAHIENLHDVLRALKKLCAQKTMIAIENHYLGSVLAKNQFDTFYHEHPRTYSYTSFVHIADSLGMRIAKLEFPERYGGNIRVFLMSREGDKGHDRWESVYPAELGFGADLALLPDQINRWRRKKKTEIAGETHLHGKLAAKAFPGRAAILIKLLGLDESVISAVYEKPTSGKIGHYVPGTRIPILSDDEFSVPPMSDAPLLNLAWHVGEEIRSYMRARGFHGRIIDILSQRDFSDAA